MNVKQYAFVTAYLKHRDAIIAYKLATGSESTNLRSLQSAANRMLNKPGVREEIESVLKATRAEVEAEIAETTRTELMTIQRKREILAQIINGTYTVMVRAKGKNCNPCTYFNSPTISQVLAGIREDNKMAGHYAVVTTTRGKLQHIATTDLEETPNNASPRHLSRQRREGDRGTLEPDTRKLQQSATELCPPQAGESRSDGGACLPDRQGILAPDTREMQQSSTTTESPSSAAEAPAKEAPAAEAPAKEAPAAEAPAKEVAPNTREMQQITTTTASPLQGDLGVKLESDKPVTTPNLKKLLTETTRLANAPIPATLRPFFEAYETHSE